MSIVLLESLSAWWPETILSVGALFVVLASVSIHQSAASAGKEASLAMLMSWIALVMSGIALWYAPVPTANAPFSGLIICDPFSLAFRWIVLGVTALILLMVMGSREVSATMRGEYLGLILLVAVGLMVMAEANHLLMAYVGMELVSLSSYALVGFLTDKRSAEASLKYLLFGALSSGIMLFGMSLLVGLTGQLAFPELALSIAGLTGPMAKALLVAVALMLAGLAFKISMVPFHMWTPDVYEGAPLPVAALLSVGPKAAGLALLLRLMTALQPAWPTLMPLLLGLTVVTMTLGNVVALVQTNIKRLLAYSTIGQVGYLLIGATAMMTAPSGPSLGLEAILVYLVAYLFMNLGVFACAVAVVNDTGNESLDAFRGLSQRSPGLALVCALFLLSLAGIPPLLGFFGKWLLFGSALESHHVWLAVAGAVNSAIALYYYVNIIRLMYVSTPQRQSALKPALALRMALGLCAVAILAFGLFPGPLVEWLHAAAHVNLL